MRYVKDRESFLKNYKLNEENQAGSGALGNEIKWGDSLVGRLINWAIRKTGIQVAATRMDKLVPQLQKEFQNILDANSIEKLDDNEKLKIFKTQISALLGALKEVVYKREKVKIIKSVTDNTISEIESLVVDEESEESKNEILQKLKDFRKFLDQFGDDEGDGSSEGEGGEESEGEGSTGSNSFESTETYFKMVENLKALSLVIKYYTKVKVETSGVGQSSKDSYVYITKGGETIEGIQKSADINKFKLDLEKIWSLNQKALDKYIQDAAKKKVDKNKLQLSNGIKINLSKVNESYIFEANFGVGAAPERANVKGGESHLTQAFGKIKKDIEVLISQKEKGLGITAQFIDEIVANSKDKANREIIRGLYKEIRRYLVGDKKATIQDKDALYKESIEVLKDKNKLVIVAEKIARLSKRAIQFDKQGLYGGLGEFGQALQKYVETLKPILSASTETKNEFLINSYRNFISLIKEAEGDDESSGDESKPKDLKTQNVSDKIIDYFKKEFNFDAWVVNKTEIEKISKNAEKISEENKEGVIIDGIDPIINIIKLFNRAYKLHTTNTIPGGRSDGAVSRKVYDEYDAFGGSEYSSEPNAVKNGPYRNRKIFNIWEDAVLGIMSERKFQPIFSKDTKIRVGDKMYPGKGVNLRQFMTDMLDGEKLYKRGAQKQFLDKYFGDVEGVKELGEGDTSYKDKKGKLDSETNSEISGNIPTPSYKFFEYKDVEDKIERKLTGRMIKLKGVSKGKDTTIYLFVQGIDKENLLVVWSRSFHTFKNYLKKSVSGSPEVKGGEEIDPTRELYATKIERTKIFPGSNLKINSIKKDGEGIVKSSETLEFEIKETFFLAKQDGEKSGEVFALLDSGKLKICIDTYKGFKDIKTLLGKDYEGGFKPITTNS
jgi:hypothetical protein